MHGDNQSQRRGARGGGRILDDVSDPPSSSSSEGGPASFTTILTDANVQRVTEILREHGLVIIKGLLPPSQTVPWGDAALADFNAAVSRLRHHPTRPVDLMNPRTAAAAADAERRLRTPELQRDGDEGGPARGFAIWAGDGKPETFAERLLLGLAFGLLGRGKIFFGDG